MPALRIDSLRNAVDAAVLGLAEFREEIHDIHDLAYNRSRAAAADRVNGGSRDFALDTHGDMEARRLYEAAYRAVYNDVGLVGWHIGEIRSYLTKGGGTGAFDRKAVAPKHEVAAAVLAAKRRRERGEQWETFHHPIAAQPRIAYIEPTQELENLRAAVRKMAGGEKPDRSRLTPAEQEAWRRAQTPTGIPFQDLTSR